MNCHASCCSGECEEHETTNAQMLLDSLGYQHGYFGEVQTSAHEIANLALSLVKALEGLKNSECFCDVGIGSPIMAGRHSEACKAANAALREANQNYHTQS